MIMLPGFSTNEQVTEYSDERVVELIDNGLVNLGVLALEYEFNILAAAAPKDAAPVQAPAQTAQAAPSAQPAAAKKAEAPKPAAKKAEAPKPAAIRP